MEARRKDKSMVIKSADKGGAVVILDRHAYEAEIQRQLSVSTFNEKFKYNPVSPFKTSVYDSTVETTVSALAVLPKVSLSLCGLNIQFIH